MTDDEVNRLMRERAERIETDEDGQEFAVVAARSLSPDEFSAIIMSEVRKLQRARLES